MNESPRCAVGNTIGVISMKNHKWELKTGVVSSMRKTAYGYQVRSRMFGIPMEAQDIDDNTALMEREGNFILVKEPFILTDQTRIRADRWIKWANEHPDEVN